MRINSEFFYMEHAVKVDEFDIDDYTKGIQDSFGDIHFWKKTHEGWKKVCIIENMRPRSKSMYDYILWSLKGLEKKTMVDKVYRGESPSKFGERLMLEFRIRVDESIWDRLEAAQLARRMIE